MSPYGQDPNLAREIARSKSFTVKAVATLVLYWLFWFPGLVANVLFLNEAKRAQEIAGEDLPGVGCLTLLLWSNLLVIALILFGIFAVAGVSSR